MGLGRPGSPASYSGAQEPAPYVPVIADPLCSAERPNLCRAGRRSLLEHGLPGSTRHRPRDLQELRGPGNMQSRASPSRPASSLRLSRPMHPVMCLSGARRSVETEGWFRQNRTLSTSNPSERTPIPTLSGLRCAVAEGVIARSWNTLAAAVAPPTTPRIASVAVRAGA